VTVLPSSVPQSRLTELGPGIVAATTFALSDVFSKVALIAGMDVLSLATFRSVFSVVFMMGWLWLQPPPVPYSARQRWIALGIGVLFAGVVFGLFKAFESVPVPVAILVYFIYPLLTGIIGALIGIDKLGWRGAAAAIVAFFGLALIVGAQPGALALSGIAFALGAGCLRTAVLLMSRAALAGADSRLLSWYSQLSSTVIFVVISLATWNWHSPQNGFGWFALLVVSITVTIAVLTLFISINRIGPFRSALIMNLEPLLATILSAALLGEFMTAWQALGGAIMLGALVTFQLRR
jgi:drug/metabolite transporter (DMT)-like permease